MLLKRSKLLTLDGVGMIDQAAQLLPPEEKEDEEKVSPLHKALPFAVMKVITAMLVSLP